MHFNSYPVRIASYCGLLFPWTSYGWKACQEDPRLLLEQSTNLVHVALMLDMGAQLLHVKILLWWKVLLWKTNQAKKNVFYKLAKILQSWMKETSTIQNQESESESLCSYKSFYIVKDPEKVCGQQENTVREAQISSQGYFAYNLIQCIFLLCIHWFQILPQYPIAHTR